MNFLECILEIIGELITDSLFLFWRDSEYDEKKRSCLWVIVILVAIAVIVGLIWWSVFR
jgi:hypothetical protein